MIFRQRERERREIHACAPKQTSDGIASAWGRRKREYGKRHVEQDPAANHTVEEPVPRAEWEELEVAALGAVNLVEAEEGRARGASSSRRSRNAGMRN